jgi:hypothetical protein
MLSGAQRLLSLTGNKQKQILRSAPSIGNLFRKLLPKAWLICTPWLLASCGRAPSFDILGSFFPAWLVCVTLGILLTVLARWLLLRLRIALVFPVLVYPSLTALFTFALWLVFFR